MYIEILLLTDKHIMLSIYQFCHKIIIAAMHNGQNMAQKSGKVPAQSRKIEIQIGGVKHGVD